MPKTSHDPQPRGQFDKAVPGTNTYDDIRPGRVVVKNTLVVDFCYDLHSSICKVVIYEDGTFRITSSGCAVNMPMLEAYGRAHDYIREHGLKEVPRS